MSWLAGVDGCRGGWVVVLRRVGSRKIAVRTVETISDVLRWNDRPDVLCIDVPIGLLDHAVPGGRECDKVARALLGAPRASSVFSAPARPALKARGYEEAVRLNRKSSPHGIGISRQSFGILPKIREVDLTMTARLQRKILEVHPELVFYELNGCQSVADSKKTKPGLKRRIKLLQEVFSVDVSELVETHRSSTVARDDLVDAMAACWTAERVFKGREIRIPAKPDRDSRGLRMEIVR